MKVFRKYLENKLKNRTFHRNYHKNCAICPITVQIITAVTQSPLPREQIASACGISVKILNDLEAADNCCVASVQKLCEYFNIAPPSDCLQLQYTGTTNAEKDLQVTE